MVRAPHPDGELRLARIIGRLNVGGPAIQAITLTKVMSPLGFSTLLLRGSEADHEGSMDHLARELGVSPVRFSRAGRELDPRDVAALFVLARVLRRFRPHIVHTHAAKGGTLGRLAALVPGPGRPAVLIHTFHGHSLERYFSPSKARLFLAIERFLARRTTRLIAVSEEIKSDLVRLGVAPPERIEVVALGFDLSGFLADGEVRARVRAEKRSEWGIADGMRVVTLIARLVPVKRVDRFLRIAERLVERDERVRCVIVGDGELGDELRTAPVTSRLRDRLRWTGFDRDMPAVCFASDAVVLTSDNEGTPVSLIEAQAAGVPVVATRVGGTASAVRDGQSGLLADRDDEEAFAHAVLDVLEHGPQMGSRGRAYVREAFALERLVADLDHLYRELLAPPERRSRVAWSREPQPTAR
jgi:glycosyltransferase involved in cell wall biosynthesis